MLRAQIADLLSGIDPARVVVEVDGRRVQRLFDPETGQLKASLHLVRGAHILWIRAYNNADAPAQASVHVTVGAAAWPDSPDLYDLRMRFRPPGGHWPHAQGRQLSQRDVAELVG